MTDKTHAMIDIETIARDSNAVILSIGAVKFDPYYEKYKRASYKSIQPTWDHLYLKPDPMEQEKYGRVLDYDTVKWWMKQNKPEQDEVFSVYDKNGFKHSMELLKDWYKDVDIVWGHSYGFDLTILNDAFQNVSLESPWYHGKRRDSKTLFSLFDKDPRDEVNQESKHNALSDAYFQAKAVQLAFSWFYN